MRNAEDTREEFEHFVIYLAEVREYKFMDHLLTRIDDKDTYTTTWVDMVWTGWRAAVGRYF